MAGTSVYDAIVRFVGDMTGVDASLAGIPGKAGTAGTAAGQSFGSKFGGILKTTLGSLVGAGIGAAVGMALSGANELDAATKQLMADTGMTATEAAKAETAIAGLYQNNLQGFAEIGAAMGAVITKLHLTGDAATAATQLFLKFGTATGQNAADAVDNVSKALDAWNLSASDAAPLMDKLIAGHQNFKLSVADSEVALQKIAPAMQAMGMSMDDGIGLLNLFASSGLDASKASLALATAMKQLKPGQTLNDLIAQISSIADPLARGQEAAKLFGTRAGVQLAQALKPGVTSLSQFNTTAGENADATTKAADAVKSGFGAQMTLLLHQAGGALAEFGTQFGGLAMLASVVGPQFTKAIGAMLGGAIGLFTAAGPAANAAGFGVGAALQAGMLVGFAVALPALVLGAIQKAAEAIQPPGMGDLRGSAPGLLDLPKILFGGHPFGTSAADSPIALDAGHSLVWTADMFSKNTALPDAADALGTATGSAFGQSFGHNLVTPAEAALARVGWTIDQFNQKMMDALTTTADWFKAKWSELDRIANDTITAIFGPLDRAAALSATNQQIADEKKILSSKKSTAAQKADAAAQLLTLTETAEKEQIVMAGHGELTKTQYAALIATLNKQAASSNAEVANAAKLALAELKLLSAQALKTASDLAGVKLYGTGPGPKKNATGGYISAGDTTLMNELGQELYAPKGPYFTAPADGYIIPAGPSAAIMAGAKGGSSGAGSGAPQITQTIYGIQPDEVERQTLRAMRRHALQLSLAGGRA